MTHTAAATAVQTLSRVELEDALGEYIEALNASLLLMNNGNGPTYERSFTAVWLRKFVKIVSVEGGQHAGCHAFVEIATGNLIKSGGWKAPQKNSDGTLAVRFALADAGVRQGLCARLRHDAHAFAGGYLYLS